MPFQLSTLLVYINVITGPFVCSVLTCVASCTPVLCDYASAIFTWVDFCLLLIFWFLCTFISHPFLHFCMFLGVYPSEASTSVYFCWLLSRYLLQHWRLYNGFFLFPPPLQCSFSILLAVLWTPETLFYFCLFASYGQDKTLLALTHVHVFYMVLHYFIQ